MDIFLGAVIFGAVIALILIMWIVGNLFRRVGPNRALIVYGWGGTHIVTGGGRVVWPLFQSFQELSLELMSFDVAPEQQLYTSQGVAVAVEAVSQIKVRSDPLSIRTAAEQFLTKPPDEREALLRLVMEGHLRGIVGLLKVEEIVKEPEIVAGRVRDSVSDDLTKMGLEVVSFTIKKVIDENDYINNMGRPDIARVKREADIAQAEAERDTAIRRAMAMREMPRDCVLSVTVSAIARTLDAMDANLRPGRNIPRLCGVARGRQKGDSVSALRLTFPDGRLPGRLHARR